MVSTVLRIATAVA